MAGVSIERFLEGADVERAERLWFDLGRWPNFIDGFGRVISHDDAWPDAGGELVWESGPHGRGGVVERVRSRQPGVEQVCEIEDERTVGTQAVSFRADAAGSGTTIRLQLDYRLKRGGPLAAATDLLFIRRAVGDSLARTLDRFARELAAAPDDLR